MSELVIIGCVGLGVAVWMFMIGVTTKPSGGPATSPQIAEWTRRMKAWRASRSP